MIVDGREVLVHDVSPEGRGTIDSPKRAHDIHRYSNPIAPPDGGSIDAPMPPMPAFGRRTTEQLGLPRASQLPTLPVMDDTDIGGPPISADQTGKPLSGFAGALTADIKLANITKDCMLDPLERSFYDHVWCRVAENNTKLYRRVFRVMPDSEVTDWAEYKEFETYNTRFKESMEGPRTSEEGEKTDNTSPPQPQTSAGAGISAPGPGAIGKSVAEKLVGGVSISAHREPPRVIEPPNQSATDEKSSLADNREDESRAVLPADPEKTAVFGDSGTLSPKSVPAPPEEGRPLSAANSRLEVGSDSRKGRRPTFSTPERPPNSASGASANEFPLTGGVLEAAGTIKSVGSQKRRLRTSTKGSRLGFSASDDLLTRAEAEEVLNLTQGTLVQFPYDWLSEAGSNGLFPVDQVAPLQI